MATTLEHVSAFVGMAGSLALAVPFFVDFQARRDRIARLRNINAGLVNSKDIEIIKQKFRDAELERILFADPWMAICACVGAVLLIVSFAVLMI